MQFHELKTSRLCLGVDPSLANLHPFLRGELKKLGIKDFLETWSISVIDATSKHISSVKFQSAFFEAQGADGFAVLKKCCDYAKKRGLFVILDAKRGDISSTMAAYGHAAFEYFDADCLTVTPYVGTDVLEALKPWLLKDRCVYSLLVTSNASADVMQIGIYKKIFETFETYASAQKITNAIGYVVGATKISDVEIESSRDISFLMPGVGAQGAKIDKDFKNFLKKFPRSLIPVSRGITDIKPEAKISSWGDVCEYYTKTSQEFSTAIQAS